MTQQEQNCWWEHSEKSLPLHNISGFRKSKHTCRSLYVRFLLFPPIFPAKRHFSSSLKWLWIFLVSTELEKPKISHEDGGPQEQLLCTHFFTGKGDSGFKWVFFLYLRFSQGQCPECLLSIQLFFHLSLLFLQRKTKDVGLRFHRKLLCCRREIAEEASEENTVFFPLGEEKGLLKRLKSSVIPPPPLHCGCYFNM